MKKCFLVVALLACCNIPSLLLAQTPGLGTWNVLNVRDNFSGRWNGFFETQVRSQKTYDHFNYHEYKGGIGFNIAEQFNFTLAAGHYVTYEPTKTFGRVTNSEFRLWQQFTISNNVNRIKIEHRYRIEQRWMSNEYRNRFRYRMNVLIPIRRQKVVARSFYASINDEIFLTNHSPHFERNRFFAGLGYALTDLIAIQSGLLNQYDFAPGGTKTFKNYLQLSLLFTIGEEKTTRERYPTTLD